MSRITKSDLGSLAGSAGLDKAEGGRFSRTIRLSLPTGGQAERAKIASGTMLDTRFLTRDVNALAAGAPEVASLGTSGGQLVLSLPVARQVRRVRLKVPMDGDRIAAFRFDGQAVSEDPVKSASHGGQGARLDVTDSALILKRRNSGNFALAPSAIESVLLRYAPVNPRLALRLPAETGPGTPFPVQTDADDMPIFPVDGTHGADLAAAMTSLLTGLPAPLPDPLEIDLILSADQPCSARIDALDLSLVLEKRALPEKAVLRFSGRRRETQSLPLSLPTGALLSSGSVSVAISAMPPEQAVQGAPVMPLPLPTGEGLRVTDTHSAATMILLESAQVIVDAEVMLSAPNGAAELRTVLYADSEGQPVRALAESKPQTISRARPTAVSFKFAPTALPAGPVWLGLASVSGTAIAMLGGTGRLARTEGPDFVNVEDAENRGLAATLRPFASEATPAAAGGPVISLGETVLQALPTRGTAVLNIGPVITTLAEPTPLHVSSAARAVVTIEPPLLQYALPYRS
jgi:hypothetical protein